MRISVVIPAYNEEASIGNSLKALQNQTEAPDEIIVVDNGSTDRTAAIAKSFGVRVISEPTPGITPARNAGFDAARYELIARCDAETRPFPDWIKRLKTHFDDPKVVGVTGTNEFYDVPRLLKPLIETSFTIGYFGGNRLLLGHQALYGSNMAFRHSSWKKVRSKVCNNDLLVHEDIDLAIHLAPLGRIEYDSKLMVASACRALRVPLIIMATRLAKWPRTKLVHTRWKRFLHISKRDSTSARNMHRRAKAAD